MAKPRIIVLSADDDDRFDWMSDGWYEFRVRGRIKAERMMDLANDCIAAGSDVPDVIRRLEEVGFEVTRKGG